MKKLVTLLAAAGMVVAASAPANAVDVKVDYRHRISFDVKSEGFQGQNLEAAKQRVRLGLSFAASENLGGYIQFQTGKEAFGSYTGTAGTAGKISVRQMYVDWTVPATDVKVRMGRQLIGFPTEALGHNSVMDAGWGGRDGIVVATPVADWLNVTALWARTDTTEGGDPVDVDGAKSNDIFGLVADAKFDAFNAAVYAAYASLDKQEVAEAGIGLPGDYNNAMEGTGYWMGATFTLKAFDPFTLALSAAYGSVEADEASAKYNKFGHASKQEGWNVQAKASYKLSFGTPVLGAWYASGADKDDLVNKSELGVMPSVGGYIAPTRSYHDNASSLTGGHGYYAPSGNWGVQAGIEDVSFLKDLTHTFLVTYMQGTNEKECGAIFQSYKTGEKTTGNLVGQYLTEEDSLVSFDLVSTYKIYKNLAAHLELAYIINDLDEKIWGETYDENDWRAAITFDFKF